MLLHLIGTFCIVNFAKGYTYVMKQNLIGTFCIVNVAEIVSINSDDEFNRNILYCK